MWPEARAELASMEENGLLHAGQEAAWEAQILLGEGQPDAVIALAEAGSVPETTLALAHAELGDHLRAYEHGLRAVQERERGAERVMGRLCALSGDDHEAIRWYDRSLLRLDRERTFARMGSLLRSRSEYSEAAWAFGRAIRSERHTRPEDVKAMADCLRHRNQPGRAKQLEVALSDRLATETSG